MTFVYDLTIDPEAENNTHAFTLAMVGHNKSVLEVGCATGYVTKVFAERGCKVVGIEIDPEAAQQAETFAERVLVGGVEDAELWDAIDDETFDVITFGDVIEHLADPLSVLRMAKRKLKSTGFIVTSIPNVAHGDVRLSLLHGSFQYRDTGLLDRTHVHFFTLQTIHEMLREAGFVVVESKCVIMPLFHSELGARPEDFPQAVIDEVSDDPESEIYQYVMKAVIDNGSFAVLEMSAQLDTLSDRVQELNSENRHLRDKLVGYDDESILQDQQRFADQIDDLSRQVYTLHDELGSMTTHAGVLESKVGALTVELADVRQAYEESERQYALIRNSRSFRLSAPLRRLKSMGGPGA